MSPTGHGQATIKDVARHAGVSTTTVSGVINNRTDVRMAEATRKRVLASVRELNFRPNRNARSLRTRSTQTIGVVADQSLISSLPGNILRGAQGVALEHDSLLLVTTSGSDGGVGDVATIDALLDRQVDGLLVVAKSPRRISAEFGMLGVPTVLVNCFSEPAFGPSVLPNDVHGQMLAVNAALNLGHRSLVYLAGERSWRTEHRIRGFRSATRAAGLSGADAKVVYGNYSADSGYNGVNDLADGSTLPTVVLCASDQVALGAVFALRDRRIRVPQDVSVIGYDDQDDLAVATYPGLTTVAAPYLEMGERGVMVLFDLISGNSPPWSIVVRGHLVQRGSLVQPRPDIRQYIPLTSTVHD